MIYFAEAGTWYGPDAICPDINDVCKTTYVDGVFIRYAANGYDMEPSPFRSIPSVFWVIIEVRRDRPIEYPTSDSHSHAF